MITEQEKQRFQSWMCRQEEYVPSADKEAFLTRSTKSVLSVLARLKFDEGKDGRFSATPSLKLFYTILYIILTACSGNYLFVLIMCAAVTVRLAFFLSICYPTDIKRNSRISYDFDISSFAGGFYGESSDSGKHYSESIRIGNIGRYFVSRDFVE